MVVFVPAVNVTVSALSGSVAVYVAATSPAANSVVAPSTKATAVTEIVGSSLMSLTLTVTGEVVWLPAASVAIRLKL